MGRIFSALCCAAVLVLSGCSGVKIGPGWEGEYVQSEGLAPYDGKDLSAARSGALAAAQRGAVEKVVGVFVSGQTQVQKSVVINQKILAKTQGFIKRYKVLSEGKTDDGYYKVKLKALVVLKDIAASLDELNLSGRGAVTVWVPEPAGAGGAEVQRGIARALQGASYYLVEPENKPAPSAGISDLLEAAKSCNAYFIVLATASAYKLESMSQLGGFIPYRARVELKAVEAATGRVAAQSAKEASGIDAVEDIAAQKALNAAGELAAKEMLPLLRGAVRSGAPVVLKVVSLDGLDQLGKLQEALRTIPGVENFSLSQYIRGDAYIKVFIDGISAEELAASILRQKPFSLEVQSITQYELNLKAN